MARAEGSPTAGLLTDVPSCRMPDGDVGLSRCLNQALEHLLEGAATPAVVALQRTAGGISESNGRGRGNGIP